MLTDSESADDLHSFAIACLCISYFCFRACLASICSSRQYTEDFFRECKLTASKLAAATLYSLVGYDCNRWRPLLLARLFRAGNFFCRILFTCIWSLTTTESRNDMLCEGFKRFFELTWVNRGVFLCNWIVFWVTFLTDALCLLDTASRVEKRIVFCGGLEDISWSVVIMVFVVRCLRFFMKKNAVFFYDGLMSVIGTVSFIKKALSAEVITCPSTIVCRRIERVGHRNSVCLLVTFVKACSAQTASRWKIVGSSRWPWWLSLPLCKASILSLYLRLSSCYHLVWNSTSRSTCCLNAGLMLFPVALLIWKLEEVLLGVV